MYFLIGGINDSRALKDLLYFFFNVVSCNLLFLWIQDYSKKQNGDVEPISTAIVNFALLSGFVAIFIWLNFGTEYNLFGLTVTQNFWTITRIHGFLGEPTSGMLW